MKSIINNIYNLDINNVDNVIKRAKIVIENSDGLLLLVSSLDEYFLLGGHTLDNESDMDCLNREILEESGNDLKLKNLKPFLEIIHYYNIDGVISKFITTYYSLKYDLVVNYDNLNLTKDEVEHNFKLEYHSKDSIIEFLNEKMKVSKNAIVINDTICAISEYLKKN